jgi:PAS domain S-box-containing protein
VGEARPVVVRENGAPPCSWEAAAGAVKIVALGRATSDTERATLRQAECALVDGTARDAVGLARRVHAADPSLQAILVTPSKDRSRIERAVLFAPGLGEVWILTPEEVDPALVERASAVTRQRRSYRATHTRIEHDLAGIEPQAARRAVVSDAYLASLLAVLPDPVLSIDPEGKILSWNPAAERVLGYPRSEAVGKPLHEMLAPEDPAALARIVETTPDTLARDEIRFRGRHGEAGVGEITIVPVEAGGHRVRAVVLHDVTEERRVQAELEAQAAELEEQAAELEAAQVELEMANDDLQHANAALAVETERAEHARAEAEAANRAKSDFLATMSHEIRTPINAILGYTDLLDMGLAGPVTEKQAAQLERVRASSQHLLGLIEDILDLAKVEAGRMEVARERALAVNAIVAALALVVPQAAEKQIEIEDPCADDTSTFYVGDEDRVRQILANVLSNAVKFTGPGGTIRITCGTTREADPGVEVSNEGAWTYVRVTDTGIGIAPEEIESVFRPFEQVERGHTRTRGGTGLGLTISRQLARLMGGDLTVESEPGQGSTFTLWLPSEAVAHPPVEEVVLAQKKAECPRGLGPVGKALSGEIDAIVEAYRERLRTDPGVPRAAGLGDAELEYHASTLLADVAQSLLALEKSDVTPEHLLRDGGEIQRVISELHGAQRARLGWTEASLRREFGVLREEVEAGVQRKVSRTDDIGSALGLLGRFLEQAERISLESLRKASVEAARQRHKQGGTPVPLPLARAVQARPESRSCFPKRVSHGRAFDLAGDPIGHAHPRRADLSLWGADDLHLEPAEPSDRPSAQRLRTHRSDRGRGAWP